MANRRPPRSRFVHFVLLLWTGLAPTWLTGQPTVSAPVSGRDLYLAACANCHGADGRGAPLSQVGFDIPLPDFTDCSFSSREPSADWLAISHQGGPVRGFSEIMPAFGEAMTVPQLELAVRHIKTFCGNRDWPAGELNLPRPLFTEKAYPEDEAVFTVDVSLEDAGAVHNQLVYEKRIGARTQIEFVVPFGWNEFSLPSPSGSAWRGGLGDIAVAAKQTLWHSLERGSIFSVAGEVILPTGEEEAGLGNGTTIFEPFLAYGQILPSEFFFHAQSGLELPADTGKAEQEAFWRAALGRSFTAGPWGRTFSPMLEVLGGRGLESGERVNWDLVPQIQITLNRRQHVMANFGVRFPVTDSGLRDTRFVVYLLWDWFDGGFFEGW